MDCSDHRKYKTQLSITFTTDTFHFITSLATACFSVLSGPFAQILLWRIRIFGKLEMHVRLLTECHLILAYDGIP